MPKYTGLSCHGFAVGKMTVWIHIYLQPVDVVFDALGFIFTKKKVVLYCINKYIFCCCFTYSFFLQAKYI